MRVGFRSALLQGVAGAVLALSCVSGVAAQEAAKGSEQEEKKDEEGTAKQPAPAEKVVVYGTKFRNRSNETAPVLDYGLDYFQKFEPLTAGDALKRVPSVTFQSDVLEYDGARLRGLDPGYTQILINGEKVTGSDVDRSFWVDRIPAELIERVEIVRSSSADRSGDALAGAINIILRDAYSLDGGYAKLGGLHFDDGDVKPVVGGVFGTALGEGRILLGGNVQGRHNPKAKVSYRYEPNDDDELEFDNREDQSDVRDGTDYSLNGSVIYPLGGGRIDLSGAYVRTDRTETEHSLEYGDLTSVSVDDLNETSDQFEDIFEENYSLRAKWDVPFLGGEAKIKVGYASFKDDIVATEIVNEYDDGAIDDTEGTREFTDQTDDEFFATLAQTFEWDNMTFKFGADYSSKARDFRLTVAENGGGDVFPAPEDPEPGDAYEIDETRLDPFALVRGEGDLIDWEVGLRYETTDVEVAAEGVQVEADYQLLLPSAHMLFKVTEDDRFRASVARTVRRPNFDQIGPATIEEEPLDEFALRGNPNLQVESAVGFDVSYERRLGRRGVVGVNVFYRNVQDRIELVDTGETIVIPPDPEDPESEEIVYNVLTPGNIGDGTVWGIEIDLSTPLTFIGLDDTGVFMKYSWLDSDITDPVTGEGRPFNDQAEYVFNVGFIQDLPEWASAFGASYRKQGRQFNRVRGETVQTTYGADLEAFIEKRIGENFVIRLTGSNLLNAKKDETFNKWDSVDDQLSGSVGKLDEFELESEQSGPVFQLVGRYAF